MYKVIVIYLQRRDTQYITLNRAITFRSHDVVRYFFLRFGVVL